MHRVAKERERNAEREMLRLEHGFLRQSLDYEAKREQEKRKLAAQIMEENVVEKLRADQIAKRNHIKEEEMVLEAIKQNNYIEKMREEEAKNARLATMENLKSAYDVQEEMKRRQRLREREVDKAYLKTEEEAQLKNERERLKYFEVLKEKQRITNERENLYKKYAMTPLKELERQDELAQLKYISESMKREEAEKAREKEMEKQVIYKVNT
eukprot:TRINITY_DN16040_c0_g1_i1.p1 TRINITY_DN16040_c0_g1~~TRINITY_DN16040_c0_g1_i1.p1  ORF type:complete len:212 (-),score=98.78 TRINITY_DN16040_c0_g1_i1:867-1502(-)